MMVILLTSNTYLLMMENGKEKGQDTHEASPIIKSHRWKIHTIGSNESTQNTFSIVQLETSRYHGYQAPR